MGEALHQICRIQFFCNFIWSEPRQIFHMLHFTFLLEFFSIEWSARCLTEGDLLLILKKHFYFHLMKIAIFFTIKIKAWCAAVHGVAKSQIRLSNWTELINYLSSTYSPVSFSSSNPWSFSCLHNFSFSTMSFSWNPVVWWFLGCLLSKKGNVLSYIFCLAT